MTAHQNEVTMTITTEDTMTTANPTCSDCHGTGRIRKITIGRPPEENAGTIACLCTMYYRVPDGAIIHADVGTAMAARRADDERVLRTLRALNDHDFFIQDVVLVDQPGRQRCALPKWTGDVMPPDVARMRDALLASPSGGPGFPMLVAAFREAEGARRRSAAQADESYTVTLWNGATATITRDPIPVLNPYAGEHAQTESLPALSRGDRVIVRMSGILGWDGPEEARGVITAMWPDRAEVEIDGDPKARRLHIFDIAGALKRDATPELTPSGGVAADPAKAMARRNMETRANLAALDLAGAGIDTTHWSTGDLAAHYDHVLKPMYRAEDEERARVRRERDAGFNEDMAWKRRRMVEASRERTAVFGSDYSASVVERVHDWSPAGLDAAFAKLHAALAKLHAALGIPQHAAAPRGPAGLNPDHDGRLAELIGAKDGDR